MSIELTILIAVVSIIIFGIIPSRIVTKRRQKHQDDIVAKLYKIIEKESADKSIFHKRVVELEDGIEKGTGVRLRNEITKVEITFTDSEMAVMMSGVFKLIPDKAHSIADIKFYIELIEKLQEAIKKVAESH
jgi:hypothetical protein